MKIKYILLSILTIIIILTFYSCRDEFKNKREARGIWMSRFDYTRKSYDQKEVKQAILTAFQNARKARFNMIFFQVRGNADALYQSSYEPWSSLISGELGKDPGWDPLKYAVETAHSLGLELHAWINTFPAWRANDPPPLETSPRQVLLAHPEWIICDKDGNPMKPADGYISLSPGIPEVRKHIIKVVMDIVTKYDIDGIHFDYIRYPEGSNVLGYSHDLISIKRFASIEGNPGNLSWENWQREQINEFVREVYKSITGLKPWVKVSAATIGNYKKAKWNGYNVVYQDAKTWIDESKIDFIVPMTYMKRDQPSAPFVAALNEWRTMSDIRNVYPGLGAYRAEGKDGWGWTEIWEEIKLVRETGFPGIVFFSMGSLFTVWDEIGKSQFLSWANVPQFKFKTNEVPDIPKNLKVEKTINGIILKWDRIKNDKFDQPHYYNIYRSNSSKFNFDNSENLAFITSLNENSFADTLENSADHSYCITALNKNNVESKPSEIVKVGAVALSSK